MFTLGLAYLDCVYRKNFELLYLGTVIIDYQLITSIFKIFS